ncbi:MAG: NUDIX domain-containing protein [Candidatus Omnitrophica bacterium]|nr:NUDIX domain-containing protein [Candidatus Omnitrophota bacterium]
MKTKRRRILCQLRDKKRGIAFPGYWTCAPGGHVRSGEEPLKAVRRELKEEFEAQVKNLRAFKVLVRKTGKAAGVYHIFTGELSSPENGIRCHEGQKAALIPVDQVLKLRQHPLSREAFKPYFSAVDPNERSTWKVKSRTKRSGGGRQS